MTSKQKALAAVSAIAALIPDATGSDAKTLEAALSVAHRMSQSW